MEGRSKKARVLVATSGHNSELVEKLPIARQPGQQRRVAMALGPGADSLSAMPDLEPGDKLFVSAEVEVTTDCEQQQSDCAGKPYTYAPTVEARLLLARNREVNEEGGGQAIRLEGRSERCSHAEHHKVVVFPETRFEVPVKGLPWPAKETWLDLVLEAHHQQAQAGQFLLVGENDPGGKVGQDKGRLNAVRMRGQLPASRPLENRQRRVNQIPIDPEAKTVVYSQRLDDLGEGEQLLVRAELTSDSRHLNYPARISTRVYLVDEAGQTEPSGRSKEVAAFGGEIGEHNGFNCLPGQGPKTARRVGVLRLTKAANKPLFVNVVATSGDPLKKAKPGDTLKIVDPGFVRVTRFSPELKG